MIAMPNVSNGSSSLPRGQGQARKGRAGMPFSDQYDDPRLSSSFANGKAQREDSGKILYSASTDFDEQVVPALRKKLQAESAALSKRLSGHQQLPLASEDGHMWAPLGTPPSKSSSTGRSSSAAYSTPVKKTGDDRSLQPSYSSRQNEMPIASSSSSSSSAALSPSRQRDSMRDRTKSSPYESARASPQVRRALELAKKRQRELQEQEMENLRNTATNGNMAAATSSSLGPSTPNDKRTMMNGDDRQPFPGDTSFTSSSPQTSQSIALTASIKRKLARSKPTAEELQEFGPLGGLPRSPPLGSSADSRGDEDNLWGGAGGGSTSLSASPSMNRRRKRRSRSAGASEHLNSFELQKALGMVDASEIARPQQQQQEERKGADEPIESIESIEAPNVRKEFVEAGPAAQKLGPPTDQQASALEPEEREETFDPDMTNDSLASRPSNPWDEELIPTVAKRLYQERLLNESKRMSRVNGLIDTWDKDGLPLSLSVSSHNALQQIPTASLSRQEQEETRRIEERKARALQEARLQREADEIERVTRAATAQEEQEEQQRKRAEAQARAQEQQRRQQEAYKQHTYPPQGSIATTQPMNGHFNQTSSHAAKRQHQTQPAPPEPSRQDNDAGCCKCNIM